MHPLAIAAGFATLKLAIHLATNSQYGYFRDELYFLACGEHLDWGYPDHAPMIGLTAWFSRTVFGDSLPAIRFLPALAGAAKVYLAGHIAAQLGGRQFAVALACLCTLLAPVYLGIDTILSMNAFEPVFWMAAVSLAIRMVQRKDARYWVPVGILIGLGLENKHSTAFFALALTAGILASSHRWVLRTRWFWIGTGLAFGLFLPNLIWQSRNHWATLELLANVARSGKNVVLSPADFVLQQAVILLPASVLVWVPGLWLLLRRRDTRFLGISYLILLGLMMALKGKNYYLAPIYPLLFAAGAVWWQQFRRTRWLVVSSVAVMGVAIAPLSLPLLPVEKYIAYQQALGFSVPKTEVQHSGPLPQIFGDMFGWPEMVEQVAKVYHALPPEERRVAGIFANNYGEAGAIDLFGPRHGLPKSISGHQAYFLWGPRDVRGDVLIVLQDNRKNAEQHCNSVEEAASVGHPYAMRSEHFTILVCRGLKYPVAEMWPKLKKWR